MRLRFFFLLLLNTIFYSTAWSAFEVGVGTTSAMGGRPSTAIAATLASANWGMFVSTTGVANSYYFQSNYQLSLYRMFNAGDIWTGKMSAGFGVGSMYTVREFRDEGSSLALKSDDVALGPALRMHWSFFKGLFIGMDSMWGIRSLANVTSLAFQDYTCLSVGAQLW